MKPSFRLPRVFYVITGLLFVAGCFLTVLHPAVQAQEWPNPVVKPDTINELTDNVYYVPDQRVKLVPNVGILVGDNAVMVIGTGMGPENGRRVIQAVRNITDKPIRYVTSTHFHPEHHMGVQAFPASSTILINETQRQELNRKGTSFIQMFSGFSDEIANLLEPVQIIPPDVTYEGKSRVQLGNFPVVLKEVGPAHTTGDQIIYLPEQNIMFTGGLTVNRIFPIMATPDSDGSNWISVLEDLEEYDARVVVPGHGTAGGSELISDMHGYLTELRSRVKELKQQGMSLEKTQERLFSEFTEKYSSWERHTPWINNAVENFYKNE